MGLGEDKKATYTVATPSFLKASIAELMCSTRSP
jgi:hypothetical protein